MHDPSDGTTTRRALIVALAFALLCGLVGCADDGDDGAADDVGADAAADDGGADEVGVDTTDDPSDDADAGEVDAGDVAVADADATEVPPCTDRSDCDDDQVCVDGACVPGCADDADCGDGSLCIDGECVDITCAAVADCDDDNPCTDDVCEEGICRWTALSVDLGADDVAGNCRRLACVDGVVEQVADESDVPVDDGVACTAERCAGQFPQYRINHAICDDGDDLNGYEWCSPADGGCVDGEPPEWACDAPDPGWALEEICGDGQDNDGNGQADEGCPCELGSAQRCFLGPPSGRDVGACVDGVQYCVNRAAPHWSECAGGVLPQRETCESQDNDCNGCVDDLEDCEPVLLCPDQDFARPLTWYELDGPALWIARYVSWEWSVQAPPNSATFEVEDRNADRTRVYLDVHGDYVISAVATDDLANRYRCSWVVSARGDGLSVEMRWDTRGDVDMDLHLHQPDNTQDWCSPADCYFATCRGSGSGGWGYPDSPDDACPTPPCGNPRLDLDNVRGYDPENINLDNPRDGETFRIMAHMFSGSRRTNPVVSIYCGGALRGVVGEAPDDIGLTESGGGCQGHTWRVADVTTHSDADTGSVDCTVEVLTGDGGGWDVRVDDASY